MNFSDIVALAKAGFTAAQIAAMAQPAQPAQPVVQTPAQPVVQTPAQPVVQTPAQPVVQTPAQPVVQTPAQPVVQTPAQPVVQNDPIMAQLAALTTAIQSNGILNTTMPRAQSAEEILAEIINPPAAK